MIHALSELALRAIGGTYALVMLALRWRKAR